jgi:hypothetical protein
MPLIPEPLKQQLLENGRTNWQLSGQDKETVDFKPVVKLCPTSRRADRGRKSARTTNRAATSWQELMLRTRTPRPIPHLGPRLVTRGRHSHFALEGVHVK